MIESIWQPSERRVREANLNAFRAWLREHGELGDDTAQSLGHGADYASLHAWSVAQPAEFWPAVWEFCDVRASEPWSTVIDDVDRLPGARWFEGARLNFAENLLRYRDEKPALVFWNEHGARRSLIFAELYERAGQVASALRQAGVGPGDRVAGFLPNLPEAVIAMLGAAWIGAVWSSCSPDFGIKGVLDRFGQIQPKVLFTADGTFWNGKPQDSVQRVAGLLRELPSIEHVVVVPYRAAESGKTVDFSDLASGEGGPRVVTFDAFRLLGDSPPEFAQLPFDHPLYILYSSGTTGLPKCMVHGAGGTLLQHLKELVLHTDLRRRDVIFYYTTCGWMMWNWLVSSLAVGATVVLYDGSPLPSADPGVLWRMAAEAGVTVFGTSAKYLALAEKEGLRPAVDQDLTSMRTILSTGSPLAPESYDYVYREIHPDVCLASISGGTDLVSCFALGCPILPVYRGELQALGLGMSVEVWNDEGQSVIGQKGELVCTRAFPSMPVAFWNDPDGSRYHAAYFEHFPGVWRHGDWAEITPRGGLVIYGRSDATLNPGGVRIGTAEIYRQVEQLDEVLESLVIGQDWEDDVRIVLFVRLRNGVQLDDELRERLRRQIRAGASPRHVPARIVQVADIPRTISGKLSELAVRNVIHGRPVSNTDALANPESLNLYRALPELAE